MSDIRLTPETVAAGLVPRSFLLIGLAVALLGAALVLPWRAPGLALVAAATTFATIAIAVVAVGGRRALSRRWQARTLRALFAEARHPVTLTDAMGDVLWTRKGALDVRTILAQTTADPDAVLTDLREQALSEGSAERWVGRDEERRRMTVRDAGEGTLLWQVEPRPAPPSRATPTLAGPTLGFDALPVPLIELDRSGTVAVANRAARDLLCIEPGETPPLANLLEGLGRSVGEWLGEAFAGRAVHRPEVGRASRAAGDIFVQITLDRINVEDDARLIAVLQDATELKTLEAQFVQSQKMQAIGQLAGGVAHDFNNLLTAISGHCDLLLLRHTVDDPDFADLEQINQNANRAASLVRQLLAFSRKQNLRPETVDLRDTLSDLMHLLNRLVGEKVFLDVTHEPSVKMVRADKRQLEQVIMNLVVNARDAMPSGGRIHVTTGMSTLHEPLTRDRVTVPVGDYVVVRVEDAGTGIPPDRLTKIFEPFYTTKRQGEGTGLGLSTAYGIVKQTGGYIFADSVVGEGTIFTLYFPAHDHPEVKPAPGKDAVSPRAEAPATGVILLAEDEAPVRAFAARALKLRGFTVLEAENAEAALEIATNPDLSIDVFLSDVIMPGRDGPSWVREALESRPDVKVVFMSGYAEESFSEHQAQIPSSVFMQKPFSLSELIATIESLLS